MGVMAILWRYRAALGAVVVAALIFGAGYRTASHFGARRLAALELDHREALEGARREAQAAQDSARAEAEAEAAEALAAADRGRAAALASARQWRQRYEAALTEDNSLCADWSRLPVACPY